MKCLFKLLAVSLCTLAIGRLICKRHKKFKRMDCCSNISSGSASGKNFISKQCQEEHSVCYSGKSAGRN